MSRQGMKSVYIAVRKEMYAVCRVSIFELRKTKRASIMCSSFQTNTLVLHINIIILICLAAEEDDEIQFLVFVPNSVICIYIINLARKLPEVSRDFLRVKAFLLLFFLKKKERKQSKNIVCLYIYISH